MKTLYLIRGVSGSGKSDLAKTLSKLPGHVSISADDYFYNDKGEYCFNVDKLSNAHNYCRVLANSWMYSQVKGVIIVHNTSTTNKEIKFYLDAAEEHGYKVVSLIVENRHGG